MCKYGSEESSIDLESHQRASRFNEKHKEKIQTSINFYIYFKDTCYLF